VETTSKLITDPVIAEYLNRIGDTLASNSGPQVQLTLKIIDTDEINAFSLPGGFIFVDSALVLAADSEAELAAIISHEIAHLAACHAAQEMGREEVTNVASMPPIFRFVVRHITRNTVYFRPVGSFDSEADSLGIEYLYKAGYDPQAMSSILEKVKAIEKQKRGNRANAFGSHSLITDRIERTRKKINTLLPPSPEYKVDTSDFHEVKERLSKMENSHN
jgi:predicted Zn-dependent protease